MTNQPAIAAHRPRVLRAAILRELNRPLTVEEVEIPPLKRGQVLVRLSYSGVCHSQLMEARGLRGKDTYLPHLLGHEGSGRVIEVGEGVTKVRVGESVILGWIKGSGIEAGGAVYTRGETRFNAGGVTTFCDHAIVSENRVVPLPSGVPLDVAVLFGCAIPTGAGLVINEVKPRDGTSIAVFGLGGIGLSALIATRLFRCDPVIAVDVSDDKLELGREFGATHAVNAARENPVEAVMKITGGQGVDYAVEAAGLSRTIEQAFESTKPKSGLCVFASHPKHGDKICLDPFHLICGRNIRGSWGGASRPDEDVPRMAQLYRDGVFPFQKLLSEPFTLDQVNEALDALESRRITRALIRFE